MSPDTQNPPPIPGPQPAFRWSVLIVCIAGVLCSIQIAAVGIIAPIYNDMFADFGAQLPALTRFVLGVRYLWLVVGVYGVALSVYFYLEGRHGSANGFRLAALPTLFVFLVALTLTIALFLPIIQMGQVMAGTNNVAVPHV